MQELLIEVQQYIYIFIYMWNGLTQTHRSPTVLLMFCIHLQLLKALLTVFLKEEVAVLPVIRNWLAAVAAEHGLQGM